MKRLLFFVASAALALTLGSGLAYVNQAKADVKPGESIKEQRYQSGQAVNLMGTIKQIDLQKSEILLQKLDGQETAFKANEKQLARVTTGEKVRLRIRHEADGYDHVVHIERLN